MNPICYAVCYLFDKSIRGNFIDKLVAYGIEEPKSQSVVLDIITDIMNDKFIPMKLRDLDPMITDSEIVERIRQYDGWSCAGLSQVLKNLHYVFNIDGYHYVISHDVFTRAGLKFDAFLMHTPCGGRFLGLETAEYLTLCDQVATNEFSFDSYGPECQKDYLEALGGNLKGKSLGERLSALAGATKNATHVKHAANCAAIASLRRYRG